MSILRLYAVVLGVPAGSLGLGAEDEPIRAVHSGAISALVGETAGPPAVGADALRRHDAVVRRLAAEIDPLLPARFGEVAADEGSLRHVLELRAGELAEALARVAGCVQMTLRVFGATDEDDAEQPPAGATTAELPPAPGAAPAGSSLPGAFALAGPGARYLLERRREAERNRSLPEIADLRSELAPLLRAERIQRHTTGRLLATAYDLVARSDAPRYAALVHQAAERPGTPRLTLSGPWPPYAFSVGAAP